jgi:hypothetical protein
MFANNLAQVVTEGFAKVFIGIEDYAVWGEFNHGLRFGYGINDISGITDFMQAEHCTLRKQRK